MTLIHSLEVKVKAEISKLLKSAEHSLDALGATRETTAEQIHFLTKMSVRFQEMVDLALDANYVRNDWFDEKPELRLATKVVARSQRFEEKFHVHAPKYQFTSAENEQNSEPDNPEPPADLVMIVVREVQNHPDLEELEFINDEIEEAKQAGILDWIGEIYTGSR